MWRFDWLRRLRTSRRSGTSRSASRDAGRSWRVESLEPRRLLNATSVVDPGVADSDDGRPEQVQLDNATNIAAESPVLLTDSETGWITNALTGGNPGSLGSSDGPDATTGTASEVLFVDSRVADLDTLVSGARDGVDVVVLDATRDGFEQMAEYLDGRTDLDAIHVVSHGDGGTLLLGSSVVTGENLADHDATLAAIGNSLSETGDLLLYGCNVGEDTTFLGSLAELTGADIAASTDLTGADSLGGDWDLEATTGTIDVGLAFDATARDAFGNVLDANFSSPGAGDLTLDAFDNTGGTTGVTVTDAGAAYVFTLDGGGTWNGGAVGGVVNGGNTLTVTKATFTGTILFNNDTPLAGLTAAVNGGVTFATANLEFRDVGSFSSNNTIDGGTNLNVSTTGGGAINFGGAIGATAALGNITADALLAGDVTFGGTVDASGNLVANTFGTTQFNGLLGSNTALGSLTTSAGGTTVLNTGDASNNVVTGNATFNDFVTVQANTRLRVDADMTFNATVDGPGGFILTVGDNAADRATFNGAVGGITRLGSIQTSGSGTVVFNTTTVDLANASTFSTAVLVNPAGAGTTTFNAQGQLLQFNSSLGSVTSGEDSVTVAGTTNTLRLDSAIGGGANRLNNFTSNATTFLNGNTTISGTGTISFTDTLDSQAGTTRTLSVTGDTAVSFTATVGGTDALADLDITTAALDLDAVTLGATPTALWTTDTIDIGGTVNTGGGTLVIAPQTANTTIGIGGGAGTLNLDDTEIGRIDNGFTSITIGDAANGTGAVDVDAVTFNDPITIVGGSVTANGLAAGANTVSLTARTGGIVDGGAGTDVTAANVTLNATNGIGAAGDIDTAAGTVTFSNTTAGNVQITDADAVTFAGTNTVAAATTTLQTTTNTLSANDITQTNGNVTLTAVAADAQVTISATRTVNAGTGVLTVNADRIDVAGNLTTAGAGSIVIAPVTAGESIGIGGGAGDLNLDDGEIGRLTAGTLITIGDAANGSGAIDVDEVTFNDNVTIVGGTITVTQLGAGGNTVTLNARSAGAAIVDGGDAGADVTALTANLTAQSGIGSANAIETAVANLVFTNTNNQTNITDTNALLITGASNFGQGGTVIGGTTLRNNASVTSTADFTLQANAGDLTVNAGITRTGGGTINLRAEDDVLQIIGATVNSNGGTVNIVADTDADNAGGVNQSAGNILTGTLSVSASQTVSLNSATNNAASLNGSVTVAGQGFSYTDADGFDVDNQDVTTNGGAITLTAGGAGTIAILDDAANAATVASSGGAIQIVADDLDIQTALAQNGTINSGAGLVTLRPNDNTRAIDVGGAGGAGDLDITDTEIDQITSSGGITIGSGAQTGTLSLTAAITPANLAGGTFTLQSSNIVVNGGSVTTTGENVSFSGNVVLNTNTTVTTGAGGGNVVFTGTVNADAAANDRTLQVTAGTGNVDFQGAVGTTQALESLTVVSSTTTDLQNVDTRDGGISVTATTINLDGTTYVTNDNAAGIAGALLLTGNVVLNNSVAFNTDAATDGNVNVSGTVNADSAAANNRTFTVNADTGTASFGSTIGATEALADLDVTAATINLGGNVTANDGGGGAEVLLQGNVLLDADVTVLTDGTNDNNLRITGTIDDDAAGGAGDRTLVVTAGGGTVNLVGDVGGTRRLQALTVTSTAQVDVNDVSTIAAIGITGGNIDLNDVTYSSNDGNVTFTGAVDLDAAAAITVDSDADADGTDGNIEFTSTVDGNQTLNLDADTGTVTVTGATGGGTALAAFNVNAAAQADLGSVTAGNIAVTATNIDLNGTVYTANADDVTFTGAVDLDAGAGTITVTGGGAAGDNVTFTSTVDDTGSNNTLAIVSGAGDTAFQGVVGGTTALGALTVNAAGAGVIDIASIGTAGADGVVGATALGNAATTRIDFNGTVYRTTGTQTHTATAGDNLVLVGGATEFKTAATTGNDIVFATANLSLGANTVTVDTTNAGGGGTVGVATGTGGLTKEGSGSFTIAGNSTYTGTTTVSAGTLLVDGVIDNGLASANTVEVTGTLGGSGTVNNAVNILANGTLAPGGVTNATDVGTLRITQDITFTDSTSRFVVDLFGTGTFDVLEYGNAPLNDGANIVFNNARLVTNFDDPDTVAVEAPADGDAYVFLVNVDGNTPSGAATPPLTDEATGTTALNEGDAQANFDGNLGRTARVFYNTIGSGNDGGILFDGGTIDVPGQVGDDNFFILRDGNLIRVFDGGTLNGENIEDGGGNPQTPFASVAIASNTNFNVNTNVQTGNDTLTILASRDENGAGAGNDDILNDYTGTIAFDGGAVADNDTLIIRDTDNGADVLGLVVHTFTNGTDGSIVIDDDGAANNTPDGGYTINYTGVDSTQDPDGAGAQTATAGIRLDIQSETLIVAATGAADTITVENTAQAVANNPPAADGVTALLLNPGVNEQRFEFDNPVDTTTAIDADPRLEIRTLGGNDTINFNSVDAAYRASLFLNGGDDTDTINLAPSLTLGTGDNVGVLDVRAETVNLATNAVAQTIDTDGSNAATDGGSVTIRGDDANGIATVELFEFVTFDTEQDNGVGDTDNAGDVNLGSTTISADNTGFALTINAGVDAEAGQARTGGDVQLATLDGAGGQFLNGLAIDTRGQDAAGTLGAANNGTVTLGGNLSLDDDGGGTASTLTIQGGSGGAFVDVVLAADVVIDTEDANSAAGGAVTLTGTRVTGDATAGRDLTINTATTAGVGNGGGLVNLGRIDDADAGAAARTHVQRVQVTTTSTNGTAGNLVVHDDIRLDDDGGGNAALFSFDGGNVVVSGNLTIDTEENATDNVAAGAVNLNVAGTSIVTADATGFILTIDTRHDDGDGNDEGEDGGAVTIGTVTDADGVGVANRFLEGLVVNALAADNTVDDHGIVLLQGNIRVDEDTADGNADEANVTIDGVVRLPASLTIDTEEGNDARGGEISLAVGAGGATAQGGVSATNPGVDLTLTTTTTGGGLVGGNVALGVLDSTGNNFVNDLTINNAGAGGNGTLTLHGNVSLDANVADTANLVMSAPGAIVVSNTLAIDTEDGNNEAAGSVQLGEANAFNQNLSTSGISADAAGLAFSINTTSAGGNGNASFGTVDSTAGAFLESFTVTAGADGVVTLNGDIRVDDDGVGTASTGVTIGSRTRITGSRTIDTAAAGGQAGGQISLAAASGSVSATNVGADLTLDTRAADGSTAGAVTLNTFDANGGQFVDDLTILASGNAGGQVNLNGQIQLEGTAGTLAVDAFGTVVDGNAAATSIIAGEVAVRTGGSFGTAANPFETQIGTLEAAAVTGVHVNETGSLVVGGIAVPAPIAAISGVSATGANANVVLNTTGNLAVNEGSAASGAAALTAGGTLDVNATLGTTTGNATLTSTGNLGVTSTVTVGNPASATGTAALTSTTGDIAISGEVRVFNESAGAIVISAPAGNVTLTGKLHSGPNSSILLGLPPIAAFVGDVNQDTLNGTFTVQLLVGRSGEENLVALVGFNPTLNPTLANRVPAQLVTGINGGTIVTFVFNVDVDDFNARANSSAPVVFTFATAVDSLTLGNRTIQVTGAGVDLTTNGGDSTATSASPVTAPISTRLLEATTETGTGEAVESTTPTVESTTLVQQSTSVETTVTGEATEDGEPFLRILIVLPDGSTVAVKDAEGRDLRLPRTILDPSNLRRLFGALPNDRYRIVLVDPVAGTERTVLELSIEQGRPVEGTDPAPNIDPTTTDPVDGDATSDLGEPDTRLLQSGAGTAAAVLLAADFAMRRLRRDGSHPDDAERSGDRVRVRGTRGLRRRRAENADRESRSRARRLRLNGRTRRNETRTH